MIWAVALSLALHAAMACWLLSIGDGFLSAGLDAPSGGGTSGPGWEERLVWVDLGGHPGENASGDVSEETLVTGSDAERVGPGTRMGEMEAQTEQDQLAPVGAAEKNQSSPDETAPFDVTIPAEEAYELSESASITAGAPAIIEPEDGTTAEAVFMASANTIAPAAEPEPAAAEPDQAPAEPEPPVAEPEPLAAEPKSPVASKSETPARAEKSAHPQKTTVRSTSKKSSKRVIAGSSKARPPTEKPLTGAGAKGGVGESRQPGQGDGAGGDGAMAGSGGPPSGGSSGGGGAGSMVQPAQPIKRIRPPYPAMARRRGLEGVVKVEFLVDADGRVTHPRVISADPPGVFDQAVLDILPSWRFKPGLQNGRAVASWVRIPIVFRLND